MEEEVTEANFDTGKQFSSFRSFRTILDTYQNTRKQIFRIQNSQTVDRTKKNNRINEKLEFNYVMFICKFGGKHVTTSLGVRKGRSYKVGCNAYIQLALSNDKQFLEIKASNLKHTNHDGSERFFEFLPENRSLHAYESSVLEQLNLRANKTCIQNKIATEKQKFVSKKDLNNLAQKQKKGNEDELTPAVELLQTTYDADVSICHDNNCFKGLYFSTKEMRVSMSHLDIERSQILFIDGTYKLLRRNLTLMIILLEDSEGASRITGVALLATEDRATLKWFLECFKEENKVACKQTRCIMTDKDLLERDVIKKIFPGIPTYICLFHTLRTFGREMTMAKMNISGEIRNSMLALLEKLAKSSSEEAYNKTYASLCKSAPPAVRHYYDKNWHAIKEDWTVYNMIEGNLGNDTNNRLESINSKIKQVVKLNSKLVDFVESFFKWYTNRNQELRCKVALNFLKKDGIVYAHDSPEESYRKKINTLRVFSRSEKPVNAHVDDHHSA